MDSDCSGWYGHAKLCRRGQQCWSVRGEGRGWGEREGRYDRMGE